jgi:molybdopterin converting factor small subunit
MTMKTLYISIVLAAAKIPLVGQTVAEPSGPTVEATLAHLQQTDGEYRAALENITIVSMENLNRSDEAQIAAEVLALDRIEAVQPTLRDFVAQKRGEVEKRRQEMEARKAAVKAMKEKRSS